MKRKSALLSLGALSGGILLVLLGCPSPSGTTPGSQNPGGSSTPVVYAGGYSESNSVSVPGYWQDGTWNGLPPLFSNQNAQVNSIYVDSGTVYSGGWAADNTAVQVPGYWVGTTWKPLSQLATTASSSVNAIYVSSGTVYAGGFSDDANFTSHSGYWQGGSWVEVTAPTGYTNCVVTSLVVSSGTVYSGGYCTPVTGGAFAPVYWAGKSATVLSNLSGGKASSQVFAIAVYGGQVYPAGYSSDGSNDIAGEWPAAKWSSLPATATLGQAYGISVTGGSVYAAGWSEPASTVLPGTWVNGSWSALPLPTSTTAISTSAQSLFVNGTDVYVGGFVVGTTETPGYWLNGTWVPLPALSSNASTGYYSQVTSIFVTP